MKSCLAEHSVRQLFDEEGIKDCFGGNYGDRESDSDFYDTIKNSIIFCDIKKYGTAKTFANTEFFTYPGNLNYNDFLYFGAQMVTNFLS